VSATPAERTLQGNTGSLYVRSWEREEPTHVVVIAHGYGEHIERYDHVADAFREGGASVYGLDHAGHGRSDGERALIADFDQVVEDLHKLVTEARSEHTGLPVVLVGHSMGGLIATRYAQTHGDGLAGLVLSAPVIGSSEMAELVGLDPLPEVPIDPTTLSRDDSVGQAYMADPLVYHGGFKRPTLAAAAKALLEAALEAPAITGPVLWQHGEADELVPLARSRRLIALLRNADVTELIYPGARHEIFNETNRDEVLADTTRWIASVVSS
jgi:alpha-beta hydrolase superfamily lysophospholipase